MEAERPHYLLSANWRIKEPVVWFSSNPEVLRTRGADGESLNVIQEPGGIPRTREDGRPNSSRKQIHPSSAPSE